MSVFLELPTKTAVCRRIALPRLELGKMPTERVEDALPLCQFMRVALWNETCGREDNIKVDHEWIGSLDMKLM